MICLALLVLCPRPVLVAMVREHALHVLHNLVAHPLLVLWPSAGEWLHARTFPPELPVTNKALLEARTPAPDASRAERAYCAYNDARGWKTETGATVPTWSQLDRGAREVWWAVVDALDEVDEFGTEGEDAGDETSQAAEVA